MIRSVIQRLGFLLALVLLLAACGDEPTPTARTLPQPDEVARAQQRVQAIKSFGIQLARGGVRYVFDPEGLIFSGPKRVWLTLAEDGAAGLEMSATTRRGAVVFFRSAGTWNLAGDMLILETVECTNAERLTFVLCSDEGQILLNTRPLVGHGLPVEQLLTRVNVPSLRRIDLSPLRRVSLLPESGEEGR